MGERRDWKDLGGEQQREILQLMLDRLGEGVVVVDAEGSFVVFNPAAVEMVGAGPADLPPEEWSRRYGLYLDEARQSMLPLADNPLARALAGETVPEREFYVQPPEAAAGRWIRSSAFPLGPGRGAVLLLRDATRVRKLEQERAERQAELERSNEQLSRFASVASHDLQEPLRVMTSYLQLLERRHREDLDSESREFIAVAVEAAARMRKRIQDVLRYARAGRQPLQIRTLRVADLVAEVLGSLRMQIEESDAEVRVDPLPDAAADRSALFLVFQNLISNALKFTRDGRRPTVLVGGEGSTWWVEDRGPGLDPGRLEKILDASASGASGLGLPLVRRLLDLHGGRLWAERCAAGGSRLAFTLPDGKGADPT